MLLFKKVKFLYKYDPDPTTSKKHVGDGSGSNQIILDPLHGFNLAYYRTTVLKKISHNIWPALLFSLLCFIDTVLHR